MSLLTRPIPPPRPRVILRLPTAPPTTASLHQLPAHPCPFSTESSPTNTAYPPFSSPSHGAATQPRRSRLSSSLQLRAPCLAAPSVTSPTLLSALPRRPPQGTPRSRPPTPSPWALLSREWCYTCSRGPCGISTGMQSSFPPVWCRRDRSTRQPILLPPNTQCLFLPPGLCFYPQLGKPSPDHEVPCRRARPRFRDLPAIPPLHSPGHP